MSEAHFIVLILTSVTCGFIIGGVFCYFKLRDVMLDYKDAISSLIKENNELSYKIRDNKNDLANFNYGGWG